MILNVAYCKFHKSGDMINSTTNRYIDPSDSSEPATTTAGSEVIVSTETTSISITTTTQTTVVQIMVQPKAAPTNNSASTASTSIEPEIATTQISQNLIASFWNSIVRLFGNLFKDS